MLRPASVPQSLRTILDGFSHCFTAPTFRVFQALLVGFIMRPAARTVCGMLTGAGLARFWHHTRAHRFFSAARWSARQVGLTLAGLIVRHLLAPDEPILLAVDETLLHRRGPKVHAIGWWHDGSAVGDRKIGQGNSWVIVAIVVRLPFLTRPVALPVLAALCTKPGPSKPALARELIDALAHHFPDRTIHLVADAAYGCGAFAGLGPQITMTTRARTNAVFHRPTPPRTGKRGRPRKRGDRIGAPAQIAATGNWRPARIFRYGKPVIVEVTEIACLWYGAWRTDPVRVVLVRDIGGRGDDYDIALVTTDLTATTEEIVSRYAARWSIEVAFFDAKHIIGVGQARNRVKKAVERTVPFTLVCQSLIVLWYALNANPETTVARHRRNAPWYRSKKNPSTHDMLTALRTDIIADQFNAESPGRPAPEEIQDAHYMWALAAS
jgi:hypothetical protein